MAGIVGVKPEYRKDLADMLAAGIDTRGGHAAGYIVSTRDGKIVRGRALGTWKKAPDNFMQGLYGRRSAVMHARYATCGTHTIDNAHPFRIERDGEAALFGVHNGIIWGAEESAHEHNRPYTVDSKELFELLADGETDKIAKLHGYGTICWVRTDEPTTVYMCRLTDSADLAVTELPEGGCVFASTQVILREALDYAGLTTEVIWEPDTSVVYSLDVNGVLAKTDAKLCLAEWSVPSFTGHNYSGGYNSKYSYRRWNTADDNLSDEETDWILANEQADRDEEKAAKGESRYRVPKFDTEDLMRCDACDYLGPYARFQEYQWGGDTDGICPECYSTDCWYEDDDTDEIETITISADDDSTDAQIAFPSIAELMKTGTR